MARPKNQKKHLVEKYYELVWALSLQDYSSADIAQIFNRNRSVISRAVAKMPKGWAPKWRKIEP